MNAGSIRFTLAAFALAIAASGCSSWRYRGFLGTGDQVSGTLPSNKYYLSEVKFSRLSLDMAVGDSDFTQWIANYAYAPYLWHISDMDRRKGASYGADITDEIPDYCVRGADAPNIAKPIVLELVPKPEVKRGFLSFAFPLACTLGILPSNKERDIPFDIVVSFPDTGVAPCVIPAVMRMNSRFALSPLGSILYPTTEGAEACETLAGAFVLDERNDCLRRAFVKTAASAIKIAIARHENLPTAARAPIELDKDEAAIEFSEPTKVQIPDSDAAPKPAAPTPVEQSSEDEFFN